MVFRFLFVVLCLSLSFSSGRAYAAKDDKIYTLPAHYIAKHVEGTKGQKRVLMIYASWCPSCRQKMPQMMDIERAKEGSVIAVSIDENHTNFARYIRKIQSPPFKIILSKDSEYVLEKALKPIGVKSWEYIPHIVLLDENNKVAGQGSYSPSEIAEFVFQ